MDMKWEILQHPIFDIPGKFPHTDYDLDNKKVYMIVKGDLAEIMVKVNPSLYWKVSCY